MKFEKKERFELTITLEDWEAMELRTALRIVMGHTPLGDEEAAVNAFFNILCDELSASEPDQGEDAGEDLCGERVIIDEPVPGNRISYPEYCFLPVKHTRSMHESSRFTWRHGVHTLYIRDDGSYCERS